MEWWAGMESRSLSTVNVRLSAVSNMGRRGFGEARRAGMTEQEKAANDSRQTWPYRRN
jgi:hypothetical protein